MGPPPSVKLTDPVGVPDPGLFTVTVAVYVIASPSGAGLADGTSEVVVEAAVTSSGLLPLPPVKSVSPA